MFYDIVVYMVLCKGKGGKYFPCILGKFGDGSNEVEEVEDIVVVLSVEMTVLLKGLYFMK